MNQIIRNEIIELYNSFSITENFYEKEYIDAFFERISQVFNDDEIIKMYEDINNKMNLLNYENICYSLYRREMIDRYVKNNKDFFYESIVAPEYFNKLSSKCIVQLSDENISYILEMFFLSLGDDIYLFYKKLNDEGRIFSGISNETAFTSIDNSNTIIFIQELRDLIDIMILVHEIGHAYYFYLNNIKIRERENVKIELKEEIPSKIMEIKFIKFLEANGVYEPSMALENLFDYVFYKYGREKNTFESLKYTIASDIAKTTGKYIDVKEYFKHIYDTSIHKLVLENNDMKEKGKRFYK